MSDAIVAKGLIKKYVTYLRKGFLKRERRIVNALKGISFSVKYGEVFGLLGPNGAGKTTTVKILSTLLIPDDGEAWVAGYSILSDPEKVRENIGVTLSVEKGFFWKLTGRENLKYFGMLRGLKGKELENRVNHLLATMGLEDMNASDKLYEEYSLGMKARLALSRALLTDPPVLMLDEPTLGLDPPSARAIRSFLVRLAKERGKAVLITTHNMFEAELICDRLAIIDKGEIIAVGTVNQLKKTVAKKTAVEIIISGVRDQSIIKGALMSIPEIESVGVSLTPDEKFRVKILCNVEGDEVIAEAIKKLGSVGCKIYRVNVSEPTLEDVFISLTGKKEVIELDVVDKRL